MMSLHFEAVGPTLSHPNDRHRLKEAAYAPIEAVSGRKRSAGRIELIGHVESLLAMASAGGPGPSASVREIVDRLIAAADPREDSWHYLEIIEAEVLLAATGGLSFVGRGSQ
jgi:hypothetical protein